MIKVGDRVKVTAVYHENFVHFVGIVGTVTHVKKLNSNSVFIYPHSLPDNITVKFSKYMSKKVGTKSLPPFWGEWQLKAVK